MPVLHTQGAHWQNLENMTEPSMCGGDAAFCEITLSSCYYVGITYRPTKGRMVHSTGG